MKLEPPAKRVIDSNTGGTPCDKRHQNRNVSSATLPVEPR